MDEIGAYKSALDTTPKRFWSSVEGASEYDEKLKKQAIQDPAKYGGWTWKDDRIESTRRVWEWWCTHHKKLQYLLYAARLVVLVPITSAWLSVFSAKSSSFLRLARGKWAERDYVGPSYGTNQCLQVMLGVDGSNKMLMGA